MFFLKRYDIMLLYSNVGGDSLKNIIKNDNYGLYEEYDGVGNKYYLCMPDNNEVQYEIFCGLSKDNIPSEEIVSSVSSIYDTITKSKKNIIYVDIIVDTNRLIEAAKDNDNPLYNFLLDRIHQTTKHAYETIIKEKRVSINNVIITMVEKDGDDAKFIFWLERNMPNFIHSVSLRHNDNHYYSAIADTLETPIIDTSESGSGNTLAGGPSGGELTQNNGFTKKKVPPKKNNHGFGNIILVIIVLMLALIVGITVAYILVK